VAKREQTRAEQGQAGSNPEDAGTTQLADMLARDVDAEQEFARALAEASEAAGVRAQAGRRERLGTLDLELESLDATGQAATRNDDVPALPPPRRSNLLAALGNRAGSAASPAPHPLAGPRPGGLRVRQTPATPSTPGPAGVAPGGTAPAPGAQRPAAAPAPTPPQRARPAAEPASGAREQRARQGRPAADTLSDQRISELHRQLLAAKHRTKETGKVSIKGLAKSLRAAETKLRQQHKNRCIDFDVVIKNGKAVVKPIVR